MSVYVGGKLIKRLDSISITRSVENLTDTAKIVLPSILYNQPLNVLNAFKVGDDVVIDLGYDDSLNREFKGYISKAINDGSTLTLECEDPIYLFKVSLPNEELKNTNVKDILTKCIAQVNSANGSNITLDCAYDFTYDKFTIVNTTAYEVLKKVHQETKPNIYMKGDTLYVRPQYAEIFGSAEYDFATNIDKDGLDLVYKTEEDRKILVVASSKDAKGNKIEVEKGVAGGDKVTLNLPNVTDKESLSKMAEEMLKQKCYTGYEGSFTGWLYPYCDAGYKVSLHDETKEHTDGDYYALAVEVEFSPSGGKRKINLGKKL